MQLPAPPAAVSARVLELEQAVVWFKRCCFLFVGKWVFSLPGRSMYIVLNNKMVTLFWPIHWIESEKAMLCHTKGLLLSAGPLWYHSKGNCLGPQVVPYFPFFGGGFPY